MTNIEGIFDDLGGSGKVAVLLGIKPSAASEMKRRGSIPVRYWPKLIAICHSRGFIDVTYESLAMLASQKITPSHPIPTPSPEAA